MVVARNEGSTDQESEAMAAMVDDMVVEVENWGVH